MWKLPDKDKRELDKKEFDIVQLFVALLLAAIMSIVLMFAASVVAFNIMEDNAAIHDCNTLTDDDIAIGENNTYCRCDESGCHVNESLWMSTYTNVQV